MADTSDLVAQFIAFTGVFDRVWYGNEPCGDEEYRSTRGLVLDIAEHLPVA